MKSLGFWFLAPGSWDATLRVWDVRSRECLYVSNEHHAAVSGLTSHPSRPFLLLSCSRDASVRFWSLEEYISDLKLRCMSGESWSSLLSAPSLEPSAPLSLMGSGSSQILQQFPAASPVDTFKLVLTFFRFRAGWTIFSRSSISLNIARKSKSTTRSSRSKSLLEPFQQSRRAGNSFRHGLLGGKGKVWNV